MFSVTKNNSPNFPCGPVTAYAFDITIRISDLPFSCSYVYRAWAQVLEAILVAAISTFTAFLLTYSVQDCKALGRDKNPTTVQVYMCLQTQNFKCFLETAQ